MEKETERLTCPDCGNSVNESGESLQQGCFYCIDQCETCGYGECDNSC